MAGVLRRVMVASIIAAFVPGRRENRCRKSVNLRNTFVVGTAGTKKLLMMVMKLNLVFYAKICLTGDEVLLGYNRFPALPYAKPCVTQGAVPDIEINNLNDSG